MMLRKSMFYLGQSQTKFQHDAFCLRLTPAAPSAISSTSPGNQKNPKDLGVLLIWQEQFLIFYESVF